MYDIISTKGDKYTVNSEHILCLKPSGLHCMSTKNNKYKVKYFDTKTFKQVSKTFEYKADAERYLHNKKMENEIVEIEVKDYIKLPDYIKQALKGYKKGVDFKTTEVSFDPYIIGYWLGDGTSSI